MAARKTVAQPAQQNRSRISQERIISSATRLLEKKGHQDFTLLDVCKGSGLSVGAIYARFANKEQLLHTVQQRLIEVLDAESTQIVSDLSARELPFHALIPAAVRDFCGLFGHHDSILRPVMALASADRVMGAAGQQLDARMAKRFRELLLKHKAQIRHDDPERAVDTCFEVIFASATRFLGLGTAPDVKVKGNWQYFVDHLGHMTSAFLICNVDQIGKVSEPNKASRAITRKKKARKS